MTSCHPLLLLLLTFALFGLSAPARSTAGANGKDAAVRGGRGTIDHYFAPKLDDDDDVQTATPTDDDDAPSHALQVTETPATPMHDVTRDTVRRGLHLSEGGTTAHGQRAALKLCGTSKKTAG